jgi:hypothetical protein
VKRIEFCTTGSNPQSSAEIAMPAGVWVWITQFTSARALCIAPWMTKPAWLTSWGPGPSDTTLPSMSILTTLVAVTSS